MPAKSNTLYLTFDDGPDPVYTPQILEILDRHNVKATFFLLGEQISRHPETLLNLYRSKQALGLHTDSHSSITNMSKTELTDEISRNQSAIYNLVGERPRILRPPRGEINLKSLYHALSIGLRIIHYTITSNDWKYETPDQILEQIKNNQITGGEIISFHDNNQNTCLAVDAFIKEYAGKGFTFSVIN